MKKKTYFYIATGILSLTLFACDRVPAEQPGTELSTETVAESQTTESQTTESQAAESPVPEDFDVQALLETAESDAQALEDKLSGDPTLTQTDMNLLSYELYLVWDQLLNELWTLLKDTLEPGAMDTLLTEQRAWITTKEDAAKQAGQQAAGGSMAPMLSNYKSAELTRERVYELAAYLGYTGGIPQE